MRPVSFERNYILYPAGSCLASFGNTKVICTASIDPEVPSFLEGTRGGWITAEYSLLPGSTSGGRRRRDFLKRDGRSTEIQRLIGRSLRAGVYLEYLESISIVIDCDVLQADGGTRTAAVSGGWVALYDALRTLAVQQGKSGPEYFLKGQVAAVSVGYVDGEVICDLDYDHDSRAEVDMNIVKLDDNFIEIQGTGEKATYSRTQLARLLDAADEGIAEVMAAQKKALDTSLPFS